MKLYNWYCHTSRKKLKWGGNGQTCWLIDTPGLFAQSESEEDKALDSMITELKKNSEVHVFAIVLNGSKPRFDQSRKQMLRKFKQMFGDAFLDKNMSLSSPIGTTMKVPVQRG